MNLIDEGESSGLSVQPAKRRRGRPRKDPSLRQSEAAARTPGSEGGTAYLSPRANRTRITEYTVGQPVTGFVEATFDSGYLLTVRIGNSSTYLRGVVFKPGHCAPITPENDVAPHAQMIRRRDVRFTVENHSHSSAAAMPSKRKRAPDAPPISTVASVVPQPVDYPQTFGNGDADVHIVEPISMVPPSGSTPVAPGSQECDDGSISKDTSTDIDTIIEDAEESSKSSPENSALVSEQVTGNANQPFPAQSSHTEHLFNFGTGTMTDLLKAFQENSKQIVEQPTAAIPAEFHETVIGESASKKQYSVVP